MRSRLNRKKRPTKASSGDGDDGVNVVDLIGIEAWVRPVKCPKEKEH